MFDPEDEGKAPANLSSGGERDLRIGASPTGELRNFGFEEPRAEPGPGLVCENGSGKASAGQLPGGSRGGNAKAPEGTKDKASATTIEPEGGLRTSVRNIRRAANRQGFGPDGEPDGENDTWSFGSDGASAPVHEPRKP